MTDSKQHSRAVELAEELTKCWALLPTEEHKYPWRDMDEADQDARELVAALLGLEEQLEARTNALQAIYWHGCSGFVEETIIGILSPEERAAWAERQRDILDLLHASNPATEPQ